MPRGLGVGGLLACGIALAAEAPAQGRTLRAGELLTAPCLVPRSDGVLDCRPLDRHALERTPTLLADAWRRVAASAASGFARFDAAGADASGEPLYRRDGAGEARTAGAWIATHRGIMFFGRSPEGAPARVTVRARGPAGLIEGLVFVDAEELRLLTPRGGARRPERAGEPFFDLGIDLDGDGAVCGRRGAGECCPVVPRTPREITRCNERDTIGNDVWDVELDPGCDPDAAPCASEGAWDGEPWPPAHEGWPAFVAAHAASPSHGSDPRLLRRFAHEAFLDVAPQERAGRLPRWPRDVPAREPLVPDVGRGAGWDRADGVRLRLSFHGVIATTGRLRLGRRVAGVGSLFAQGGVVSRRPPAVVARKAARMLPAPSWSIPDPCEE